MCKNSLDVLKEFMYYAIFLFGLLYVFLAAGPWVPHRIVTGIQLEYLHIRELSSDLSNHVKFVRALLRDLIPILAKQRNVFDLYSPRQRLLTITISIEELKVIELLECLFRISTHIEDGIPDDISPYQETLVPQSSASKGDCLKTRERH